MDPRMLRRNFLRGLFRGCAWCGQSCQPSSDSLSRSAWWSVCAKAGRYRVDLFRVCIRPDDWLRRFRAQVSAHTRAGGVIGLCGVLLTALLAAIAVKALTEATEDRER